MESIEIVNAPGSKFEGDISRLRVRPFPGHQNGTALAAFIELRVSLPFIVEQYQ
jgi:hypothetical protein